jgi:hypothetical protein
VAGPLLHKILDNHPVTRTAHAALFPSPCSVLPQPWAWAGAEVLWLILHCGFCIQICSL